MDLISLICTMFEMKIFVVLSVSLDSNAFVFVWGLHFLVGSCALFTGPAGTEKYKSSFKIGFHGIIYTFKNYFAIVFLAINFQFLTINGIQTHHKSLFLSIFLVENLVLSLLTSNN